MKEETKDVSIFIITEDGDVIFGDEYDRGHIRYIMLTNDVLNNEFGDNNTIFISCDSISYINGIGFPKEIMDYNSKFILKDGDKTYNEGFQGIPMLAVLGYNIDNSLERGELFETDEEVSNDFEGYKHTKRMLSSINRLYNEVNQLDDAYSLLTFAPALILTNNIKEVFKGHTVKSFLPSIGQLSIILNNIEEINNFLLNKLDIFYNKYRKDDEKNDMLNYFLWSSSEYACDIYQNDGMWVMDIGLIHVNSKTDSFHRILPLFNLNDLI